MNANGKRHVQRRDSSDSEQASDDSDGSASSESDRGQSFVQLTHADAYFEAHAKAAKTSDLLFSNLVDSAFTESTYLEALPANDPENLLEAYDARFALWLAELDAGFSLCFFGRGSKRSLLERFAQKCLAKRGDVVSVNGYVPALSLVDVLQAIEKDVLKGDVPAMSGEGDRTEQRARAICQAYRFSNEGQERATRPLYILLHNIEGAALRSMKIRGVLAMLSAAPRIHFVTSFDHHRTPLLLPTRLMTSRPPFDIDGDGENGFEARTFHCVFHHTPTLKPYTYEPLIAGVPSTIFDAAVFASSAVRGAGRGTSAQRIAGCISVLSSLGKDQHDIFVYLADTQRKAKGEPTPVSSLQDQFLLINPDRFDGLLRELHDHQVLEKKDDQALRVMLNIDELERILDHTILAEAVERIIADD